MVAFSGPLDQLNRFGVDCTVFDMKSLQLEYYRWSICSNHFSSSAFKVSKHYAQGLARRVQRVNGVDLWEAPLNGTWEMDKKTPSCFCEE